LILRVLKASTTFDLLLAFAPMTMRGPIVEVPNYFIATRVLQIIFALLVLSLSAYLLSQTSGGVFAVSFLSF
jgi:hypothetical protein